MHLRVQDVDAFKSVGNWIHSFDGSGWSIQSIEWTQDGWSAKMKIRRRSDFVFNNMDAIGFEEREVLVEVVA